MHVEPRVERDYLPDQIKRPGPVPEQYPRHVRLLDQKDFNFVFAGAKPFRSKAFTLLTRRNNLQHARLGLAISKKAARKAVARNRLKRLVRESFRCWKHRLPNVDIVVLAKPEAVNMRNHEITRILEKQWSSIKNNFTE